MSVSKTQMENIMKENPEFGKDINVSTEEAGNFDPSNSVLYFRSLKEAAEKLNLLSLSSTDESAVQTSAHTSFSGVIERDYITRMVNKNSGVNIYLGPELNRSQYFKVPMRENEIVTEKIKCDEESSILRFVILKVLPNKMTKTVCHVEGNAFVQISKSHLVYAGELLRDEAIKENTVKSAYIDVAKPKVIIDVNTELNVIRCGTYYPSGSEGNVVEKGTEWICVPLMMPKSVIDNINSEVNDVFANKFDDIIEKMIDPDCTNEEFKQKARDFLKSIFEANEFINKYSLVRDYVDNKLPIVKYDEEAIDKINITNNLFPAYGSENCMSLSNPETEDEFGIPSFTTKEYNNIKVLGINKEVISEILDGARNTVKAAVETIKANTEYIEEHKAEVYEAKCDLSVAIGENDWFETCKDKLDVLIDTHNCELEIEGSERYKRNTKNQLNSFKALSNRIQEKIDNGDFRNTYLALCVDKMRSMCKNIFGENESNNYCIFIDWLKLINHYYTNAIGANDAKDKLQKVYTATLINDIGERDRFGNYKPSVEECYDRLKTNLINIKDIPNDISSDEESEELMIRAGSRYEFLRALAIEPFEVITKIYPQIRNSIKSVPFSDEEAKVFTNKMKEIGFVHSYSVENMEAVERICEALKNTKEELNKDNNFEKLLKSAKANANLFAAKLSNMKIKGRSNKLGAYCKIMVLLANSKWLDPIEFGYILASDNSLENKKFINLETGTEATKEEYVNMLDDDKAKYGIYTPLTEDQRQDLLMQYIVDTALVSQLFTVLYKFYNSYEKEFENVKDVDSEYMMTSVFSLLVPSINIIETLDLSKIEDGNTINVLEYIDSEKQSKLGSNSIKDSLYGINNKDDVITLRTMYVDFAIKYIENAICGIKLI